MNTETPPHLEVEPLNVLCAQANTGQLDDPGAQWTMVCSNLALIQVTHTHLSASGKLPRRNLMLPLMSLEGRHTPPSDDHDYLIEFCCCSICVPQLGRYTHNQ